MADAPDPRPAPPRRSPLVPLAAVALLTAVALNLAITTNNFPDFFIYRAGAAIGLRGESPYDAEKIRTAVEGQFPAHEKLAANCGFFLPPAAVAVFAPFAALPYPAAKVAWALATGLSGLGVLLLPRLFGRTRGQVDALWPAAPLAAFAVLLSPTFTLLIVVVGQTTLVFVGCVAAGQWCFERKRPLLGAVLWAVPFIKPHLALPLLPLAWYLGGWKRAAAVAGVVGVLNLIGAQVAGGSPLFVREYLDYLAAGHKAVAFNRVELNPQVTSWNRLLYAARGPLVELSAVTTLAGYLVWFGLVAGRSAATRTAPSGAWALAAAAVGSVLCSQVLGYEALVLALVLPWLLDLLAARRWGWACAAAGLLAVQWVPFPPYLAWVESLRLGEPREALALSYRAFGIAGLAAALLAGPAVNRPATAP